MRPHPATPGVEDTVKSNSGPQAFWVLSELQKGLGRILKQQVIHHPPVVSAQRIKFMGQGKNTMVIGYR